MKALCLIRQAPVYRREAFVRGLKRSGYEVVDELRNPDPEDLMVGWNCYGNTLEQRKHFESRGARCLIVENGYLNSLTSEPWFAMALHDHAGLGTWPDGGPERWDGMGIDLAPWKTDGKEVLILAQRGIGSPDVASPDSWAERTRARLGVGRIRQHPGKYPATVTLADDLRNVASVVTWGSSAALVALALGVPVWYAMDRWIGVSACRHLKLFGREPLCDDAARSGMFRRLAWAQWRLSEIASGEAIDCLRSRRPVRQEQGAGA